MSRRFVFSILTVLLLCSASFGQSFVVNFFYVSSGGAPLYTTCDGNTGLPDGRICRIFHDANANGPDDTDLQAALCDLPPDCETGPVGTVNYNQFFTNGVAMGEGPGYFLTELAFSSAAGMPAVPNYYIRIYEANQDTVLWTSAVKTFIPGPQEVFFTRAEWTCGHGGPQCLVRDEQE